MLRYIGWKFRSSVHISDTNHQLLRTCLKQREHVLLSNNPVTSDDRSNNLKYSHDLRKLTMCFAIELSLAFKILEACLVEKLNKRNLILQSKGNETLVIGGGLGISVPAREQGTTAPKCSKSL